jgi:hypothetical protein
MATVIPICVADALEDRVILNHIRKLRSGIPEQKLEAAKRLANLAANGHGAGPGALSITGARREIAEAGGIEALIMVARDGETVQHKAVAAAALANLIANSAENQAAVVAAGGFPLLIALVRDRSDGTGAPQRANAAAALGNLALDDSINQTTLGAEGGIAALIELWKEATIDGDADADDEREWQEVAAVAALRAGTSGHLKNLETMREKLSGAEFALVTNQESGGGGVDSEAPAPLTAVLDAPNQLTLLAGFVGAEPIEMGTVRYHWVNCGMVGMNLDGDVFLPNIVPPVGHNDGVTPAYDALGLINDWEAIELLWRETLFRQTDGELVRGLDAMPRRVLGVSEPHRLRVLLTLPSITTRAHLLRVTQILFEALGVAAVHVVPREALLDTMAARGTAAADGPSCWHIASARATDSATAWLSRDSYDECGPEAVLPIWEAA